MMGRIVIAAYRPKRGKQQALRRLMDEHAPKLRSLGLVTDREPIIMEAGDGTVVEVFEWKSAEAIEAAHTDPVVLEMWERLDDNDWLAGRVLARAVTRSFAAIRAQNE